MADTVGAYVRPGILVGAVDAFDFHGVYVPTVTHVVSDITAPIVNNFSPPAYTGLAPGQLVSFDVTDETFLALVVVIARFSGDPDADEVVWDGFEFSARYAGFSSRAPIANGYRFSIARQGGWPKPPRIRVVAIDKGGNVP